MPLIDTSNEINAPTEVNEQFHHIEGQYHQLSAANQKEEISLISEENCATVKLQSKQKQHQNKQQQQQQQLAILNSSSSANLNCNRSFLSQTNHSNNDNNNNNSNDLQQANRVTSDSEEAHFQDQQHHQSSYQLEASANSDSLPNNKQTAIGEHSQLR